MSSKFRPVFWVSLFLAFVSMKANAQSIGFSISDNSPSSDQLTVTALDETTLTPITGATVSITDGIDDSIGFGSVTDRMRADLNGSTQFSRLSPSPKTVTVTKSGYATLSVIGIQGSEMTAYLRPIVATPQTVVSSGTITTWDNIGDDTSVAHAGLVFKTAGALDLLNFQIGNFVSPLQDTIDLGGMLGSHKIPSNIVLPKQDLSYLFMTISLDKETYRLPIPAGESVGLTAVEVEANVDDVVSAAQAKSFDVGILNKVRFKRAGMSQGFSATRDVSVNVDATLELTPMHQVQITKMPPFTADVVAASFTDVNGDKSALVPSDAKAIYNTQDQSGPDAVTLNAPQAVDASKHAVAAVAMNTQAMQISGVLVAPAGKSVQAGEFLNTPALGQSQALPANVTLPSAQQGVSAAIFETDQPVWYIYSLPAAGSVNIPTGKLTAGLTIKSYSVNQMEFAQFNATSLDGTKIMSQLQRFARSSAKIK